MPYFVMLILFVTESLADISRHFYKFILRMNASC